MKCILELQWQLDVASAPPSNSHVCMMRSLLDLTKKLHSAPNHFNILRLLEKVEQIKGVNLCICCVENCLLNFTLSVLHEKVVLFNIITIKLRFQCWFRGLISNFKYARTIFL